MSLRLPTLACKPLDTVEVSDEGIEVGTAFGRKNAVPLRRESDPETASAGQERCVGT